MAWDGYFTYDGQEIINVTRTETYAKNAGLGWFRPLFENDSLPYMLGDGLRYTTPLFDNAPWVDPDVPESHDFYGFYPLNITGIENSSRSAPVVQSLIEGGTVGRLRHGTKELLFNGVLIAATEAAAAYGMQWLRRTLNLKHCPPVHTVNKKGVHPTGAELVYLSSSPDMEDIPDDRIRLVAATLDGGYFVGDVVVQTDEPDLDGGPVLSLSDAQFEGGTPGRTGGFIEAGGVYPFADAGEEVIITSDGRDCLTEYLRSLRKVTFNSGPSLLSKRETTDGGAVWTVEFGGVAGNPYELGAEVPVIRGFLDPTVAVPWAGGVEPEGAIIDPDGYIYTEQDCAVTEYQPIYDPLCPAIIPPPPPPSVEMGCFKPPRNWRRRQVTIPKQYVPLWGEVAPKIEVYARDRSVRNLRLRFFQAPPQGEDISDYACDYVSDVVISYVPLGHTLTLDSADRSVYVTSPTGARQRADSLLFASDGTPFDWPSMTCGEAYVVAVDLPQTETPPVIDLSLYSMVV